MIKQLFSKFDFLFNGRIFSLLVSSTIYDCMFIIPYMNIIINETSKSSLLVFFVFFIKTFSRILLDIPVGKLADSTIPIWLTTIIAVLLRICSVFFLFSHTFVCVCVSVFLDSASLSFFRGKVNVWQRNTLIEEKMEESYIRFNGIYSIIIYICTFSCSMIGRVIFKSGGFPRLIIASLLMLFLDLIMFILVGKEQAKRDKLTPVKRKPVQTSRKKSNIFAGFSHIYRMSSTNEDTVGSTNAYHNGNRREIIGFSIILGLCVLGWHVNSINQFLALRITQSNEFAVHMFNTGISMMFASSFISLFIGRKISPKKLSVIVFFLMFLIVFATVLTVPIGMFLNYISLPNVAKFFLEGKGAVIFAVPYLLMFTTCEIVIREHILRSVGESMQYTTIAIATSIGSFAAMIITLVFHMLNHFVNYKIAHFSVFSVIVAIGFLGLYFLFVDDKKMNSKSIIENGKNAMTK